MDLNRIPPWLLCVPLPEATLKKLQVRQMPIIKNEGMDTAADAFI